MKCLANQIYRIEQPSGILAVEYKKSERACFCFDIAQVKCAPLLPEVKGTMSRKAIVKPNRSPLKSNFLKDSDLFVEIRPYVLITRLAKEESPSMPPFANEVPTLCFSNKMKCQLSDSRGEEDK